MLKSTKHFSINSELINSIDLSIFKNQKIIEPFVGDGDLLKLCSALGGVYKCYDIEPKNLSNFEQKDTLLNNVLESDCYVITNPPYLAKNKMNKELKDKYKNILNSHINDLYQIFINQLIKTPIKGGLIIIPINFLIGKETEFIRNEFKNVYNITHINIFEKKMFENTTQSVVTILFINKSNIIQNDLKINLYTKQNTYKNIDSNIFDNDIFNYFKIKNDKIKFIRYYNIPKNYKSTHIKINLIDTSNKSICAEYNENPKEHIITDRSFMNVCCNHNLSQNLQIRLIKVFNKKLEKYRKQTFSICLSSYREYSRKRLTFSEASHILSSCFK